MNRLPPWIAAAALFSLVIVCALQLPLCRFAEEEITIDVWPQEIRVSGVYHYHNSLPIAVQQGLSVPFPVDAEHPEPFLVSASTSLRRILGTYRCEVSVPAHGEATFELHYAQFAPHRNGRYLLTTTRPWRLPLRRGVYRIVPHGVTIRTSNYALRAGGFVRTNFMPQHDWRFTWD